MPHCYITTLAHHIVIDTSTMAVIIIEYIQRINMALHDGVMSRRCHTSSSLYYHYHARVGVNNNLRTHPLCNGRIRSHKAICRRVAMGTHRQWMAPLDYAWNRRNTFGQIQVQVDIFENRKFKISSKLWWLQLHIWYQTKGHIIIFHLKGHAMKLNCDDYKIFYKKHDFCQKLPF